MSDQEQSFVCILEEEFERLKRSQDFLLDIQSASRDRINIIRLEVEKELKYKLEKIERNYVEYQMFINDLNGEVKHLEVENQRLQKNNDEKINFVRNEYFGLIKQSVEYYATLLKKQTSNLTSLIEKEKYKLNSEIKDISANLNYLVNSEKNKSEKVRVFLSDLTKIFEDTEKINTSKFNQSNNIKDLKRNLIDAISDFEAGFYESAWITAKSIYWKLTDIRNEIKETEKKYFVIESAIYELISELLNEIESGKKLKTTFNNSTQLIDLNYWSNGRVNILRKELLEILKKIKDNQCNFDELNNIMKKTLFYKNTIKQIINNAKENILLSQLKYSYAKTIADKLNSMFFYPVDSYYKDNDYRKSYELVLKNANDDTLKIEVYDEKKAIFFKVTYENDDKDKFNYLKRFFEQYEEVKSNQ